MNNQKNKNIKPLKIGIFGLGTVGVGVLQLLQINKQRIEEDGFRLKVARVVVKNLSKKRPLGKVKLAPSVVSDNPNHIFKCDDLDFIVELVGDKRLTKKIFQHCHKKKIPLVTANKAFLAEEGDYLKTFSGPFLGFDASVAGSIPILKTLEQGLNGNQIDSIVGIINGTANFILTNMEEKGSSFQEELKAAQKMGYAEADPTFDIDGQDTAHKLNVIMAIAFRRYFNYSQLDISGIRYLDSLDLQYASELGYKIKLLAIAKQHLVKNSRGGSKKTYEARVHATLIPKGSILASVKGSYNAIYVQGNFSGPHLSYGQGAGAHPTASAVVSDLIAAAKHINKSAKSSAEEQTYFFKQPPSTILPLAAIKTHYFIRLNIVDKIGVLADITRELSKHYISISKVIQKQLGRESAVDLILLTHLSEEKNLVKAMDKIAKKRFVAQPPRWIRIESEVH